MEANPRPAIVIEASSIGGAVQRPSLGIAVPERRRLGGGEDPALRRGPGAPAPVLAQHPDQLRRQGDIADRRRSLRRNPPRRRTAMGTGELGAEVQFAGDKVDVAPDQPQQLGDGKAV